MILGGIPLLALAAWQEGAEAPARLAQLTGEWLDLAIGLVEARRPAGF